MNDLVDDFVQDQENSLRHRPRKPSFLFKIIDPQDAAFESQLLSASKPISPKLQNLLKNQKRLLSAKRCLLLAQAYEQQENKEFAANYYKEALNRNPECFEAF